MNIVKQDNVIREIKSLPKVEKELLELERIYWQFKVHSL